MSPTSTNQPTERIVRQLGLSTAFPVALLPLRLETRFSDNQLRVRIFPDEIFADTHEHALTSDEARDGAAYVASIDTTDERAQWSLLVRRYGAPRAAWIARVYSSSSPPWRDHSWTRAARATLPDSWIVRAYSGTQTFTKTIPKVRQPLALTVSPNPGAQEPISDGLQIETELKWTLDFEAAVEAGMAVSIDLTRPDGAPAPPVPPLARVVGVPGPGAPPHPVGAPPPVGVHPAPHDVDVVVIGVNNQAPAEGAKQLRDLFDAHHYTRGFAFVAPGTPTSHTDAAPSAFPADRPGDPDNFALERQGLDLAQHDNSDGDRFARALGLITAEGEKVAAVEHVDGADRAQELHASAMNGALWPATLGYFMEQMMAPEFDEKTIERARRHFVDQVRPGGPLPAFRIGRVPYGLLPVVSLSRYAPDSPLAHALRVLRDDHYLEAVTSVPRVTPGSSDPDGDLLKALAVDASCRQVRMRALLGEDVTTNTAGLFGVAAANAFLTQQARRAAAAGALLASVGLGTDTRIGGIDPGATADLVGVPLVTSAPLSEKQSVTYIQTLLRWAGESNAPIEVTSIRGDRLVGKPLLYCVLRHALLLEMDRISVTRLIKSKKLMLMDRAEPELVNLGGSHTLTGYERVAEAVASPDYSKALAPYRACLSTLSSLSSAELERRFGETLDACSHRLESWITSLANARLWELRGKEPTGCHFGAFGWVENVRQATATPPAGGFIHAPSSAHAATAAILRNGYLSRGGGGSSYAVDLGSARVRAALDLLDGTRQGEPLAALLGYQFERALHEGKLERLISKFRSDYPLVAGRTPDGAGPVEKVAASNVVDGLKLRAANPKPPASLDSTEAVAFRNALQALDDAVDGLADLLTAESVFQAVRGNPHAAAASLDAMSQGVLPPDVDVARTPLGGATFTQRLAVVLDGTAAASKHATPRAAAEPFLDAWVAQLLGKLSEVGCRVLAPDGTHKSVTLDALGLRPLDLVALAKTPASGLGDGELDRRVLDAAGADPGSRIEYDASDVAHSFAEWMELARAAGALLGGSRALLPADLVTPMDASSAPITDQMANDAKARARDALATLGTAEEAVGSALTPVAAKLADATQPGPTAAELETLRAALRSASLFGVTGAYPDPHAAAEELASLASSTSKEFASRRSRAPSLEAPPDAASLLAAATETMKAVFGRDFLFLPRLSPPAPSTLATALTETPSLLADRHLPRRVLQQVARVRPGVGRWRSLFLYAEALGTLSPAVDVAQLPTQQTSWAPADGAAPEDGTVSLLLHRPTPTAPTKTWAGFVVDEWNELIPSKMQSTSIAFRHETPVAEAPQAVLLAVPPKTAQPTWDEETLFDTVREALALAKVRLVDDIDGLRPFLPGICLTGNTANETISTNLLPMLVADPAISRKV